MLSDSKLPLVSTALYLHNRSSTKGLQGITPFKAWHGVKPDVSSLRIFGYGAYAHILIVERNKLDPKTRKCGMVSSGRGTVSMIPVVMKYFIVATLSSMSPRFLEFRRSNDTVKRNMLSLKLRTLYQKTLACH